MKVLVVAPSIYDTSPGSRFRIEQWMSYLEKEGARFTFAPFEDEKLHRVIYTPKNYIKKSSSILRAFLRRFSLLTEVKKHDVVFIYEEASRIGPAIIERLINRTGIPIVYDFADPIWMPYISPANKYLSYLKCFGKTGKICEMSAHIIVGNKYLAEYAIQYNPRVTIVPITIDTDKYTVKKWDEQRNNDIPIIGWSGSYSTIWHLDGLRDVLRKLKERHNFKLHVIGTSTYQLDSVDVYAREWLSETEVNDLQQFDIGIMPLPDDQWVRFRTHLKVRQYMGVGVPAVASPVGVINEVIQDGVNGFLAATEDEWVEKLSLLIEDPVLRRTMGEAGRRTIEERYSAKIWAPKVLDILQSVSYP